MCVITTCTNGSGVRRGGADEDPSRSEDWSGSGVQFCKLFAVVGGRMDDDAFGFQD